MEKLENEHKILTEAGFLKYLYSGAIINGPAPGTFTGSYLNKVDDTHFGDWQITLPDYSISSKWELLYNSLDFNNRTKLDMWGRKEFNTLEELLEVYKTKNEINQPNNQ